jgi:hypothetical protein
MLTHYFSALYVVAFALVALVSSRRRRAIRDLILLSLPALVATAAWFVFLLPLERVSEAGRLLNWITPPDPFRVLRVGLLLFGVPLVPMGIRFALGSAILLGAVAGVLLLRRPGDRPRVSREALWLLGAAIVVPAGLILLAYAVSGTSYWVARQLLPSQAFVAIAAALGIAVIARAHRGLAALGLVGLVVLNNPGRLYGPPALRNDPFNRIAEDLKAQRQPGELAVATTSNTLWILNYYLSGADSATLLRHGPYHPDPVDWGPYPYPPLTDSVLAAQAALWVVTGWRADRRDSLVGAGWRVESNRAYPLARRPELWPADTVRLMKLVPPPQ